MLKEVKFINFRGFKEHILPMRKTCIVVGINNAGKSTIVEALRLISLVTNRYQNLTYTKPPVDAGISTSLWVVSPSIASMAINFDNVFHLLGDPPSIIKASFSGGATVEVYITNAKRIYGVIRGSSGRNVKNKTEAKSVALPQIHILPQVAPLARDERILGESYVKNNISTDIAHLHFRNQLRLMKKEYAEFVKLAAMTWPGLDIIELVGEKGMPGDALGLLVKDGEFVAEASWMGHGLQIWLQAVWFMVRAEATATVVLDEPDVYLHPDLQRKLMRLIHSRYSQCIMATHSIEIMSEVEPSEILIVNKRIKRSRYADGYPKLKKLIDHIGSAHNVNLARISATKKFIIIEGDDLDIISVLHKTLFPTLVSLLSSLPHLPLGGWGGWDYAIGSKLTFENYIGDKVTIYCIFDRDFHTPAQINKRYDQAADRGIDLHIWTRKELENYLIVPSVISRVIDSRIEKRKKPPTILEIESQLDLIADEQRSSVTVRLATEFGYDDRRGGLPEAMKKAQEVVDSAWMKPEERRAILPGKEVISALSKWAQEKYGVSFGPMTLAKNMQKEEVPLEMINILRFMEEGQSLSSLRQRRFTVV